MKEIAVLKKIKHKNLIQLFEVIYDEEQQLLFFVMEFLNEGILDQFKCKKDQKLKIIKIIEALMYLHENA